MCTVSWLIGKSGYQLFDNRDESRGRLAALPPRVSTLNGVRYIAPTDVDAGGTWIGVNEFGVALTVLNAWDISMAPPPEGFLSRGGLVRGHMDARDLEELEQRLRGLRLHRYQGFRLVAFAPQCKEPLVLAWDGENLEHEEPIMPLASSSLGPAEAHRARRSALEALRDEDEGQPAASADAALLERLHGSHMPARGPWSVCMHREDARTVSATHVTVSEECALLRYAPGPPCRTAYAAPLTLERAAR